MSDRLVVLTDDEEARVGKKMVHVGDPSAERVLDWDHREVAVTRLNRSKGLGKSIETDRFQIGIYGGARQVRIRP